MDLRDYGFTPDGMPENGKGIPARITAVHKQRYGLVCAYGETYGRLKTKEYYRDVEAFPTVGDFVLINYLSGGDSQIMKTLPRKPFSPAGILRRGEENRRWRQTLTMCLSCSL